MSNDDDDDVDDDDDDGDVDDGDETNSAQKNLCISLRESVLSCSSLFL